MAKVNMSVAKKDQMVSDDSIVLWKNLSGGGGFQFYRGLQRKDQDLSVPSFWDGKDMDDIYRLLLDHIGKFLESGKLEDLPPFDGQEMYQQVQKTMQRPKAKL